MTLCVKCERARGNWISFSGSEVQVFLMKFVSKEAQNSNIVTAIFNSTQQLGHAFVTSFLPRDFFQIVSDKTFNLTTSLGKGCGQTSSKLQNDSIEDSDLDNRLDKIDFADLGGSWRMPSQLHVFLLPANFKSDGMTSGQFQNSGLRSRFF